MASHRRDRLVGLLKSRYGNSQTRLAAAAKLTKGRISQLLSDDEAFGEVAAKRLAKRLGLPADFFDVDMPSAIALLSEQALEIALVYDQASELEKRKVLAAMEIAGVYLVTDAAHSSAPKTEMVVFPRPVADRPPAHGDLLASDPQAPGRSADQPAKPTKRGKTK